MEDHKTVTKLIQKGSFMATLDLKDAYHLIPIFKQHKKYLRFYFNSQLYEYNCLPFGLNSAPLVFTKIMKPILAYLRSRNHTCVLFLDDFLLFGNSQKECHNNIMSTIKLLQNLGFIVNYKKSVLCPSTCVRYLGFLYNSTTMTVSLPEEKIFKVLKLLRKFSNSRNCRIREFARFLGTLCSICPAVKYGWVYTKLFEREKFLALKKSAGNFNAKMEISSILKEDFKWWLTNLSTANNSIKKDSYCMEVFSDASNTGWGGYCNGERIHGFWTESEKTYHINYLELKAVYLVLKHFAKNASDCNILFRVDNTTAMAYINKMGSVQHQSLNKLSRIIWQWCEGKNIYLYASYIKSKDNFEADAQSRLKLSKETEWEISNLVFKDIISTFGKPEVDLFASKMNAKCKRFVSWLGDSECIAVDAFTIKWNKFFFYAFPPFSVILRALQKIKGEKARGIVVVPFWTSQPWYPLFTSLLESTPLVFEANERLLSFRNVPHPLWRKISLVAGVLSSKP
uniref:Reverse transcriptase domain-containing protein n=1 Tax=Photinus pyralis TaxID=7054 RepID=A0A1Y1M5T5_PHOPY